MSATESQGSALWLQIRKAVHAAPRMLCQQMDSAAAAHLDYLASLGITQAGFVTMISRQASFPCLPIPFCTGIEGDMSARHVPKLRGERNFQLCRCIGVTKAELCSR